MPSEGPEPCGDAASKVVAAGVHPAAGGSRAHSQAAPDSLSGLSGPPLREPSRPGTQRQDACANVHRAGQKVLTLRCATPRESAARQPPYADIGGFSLHAAVRVEVHDGKRLEQPCRYITRPALSDERIQANAAGQVELKLRTPWRDGTAHLVISRWNSCRVERRRCRGCT